MEGGGPRVVALLIVGEAEFGADAEDGVGGCWGGAVSPGVGGPARQARRAARGWGDTRLLEDAGATGWRCADVQVDQAGLAEQRQVAQDGHDGPIADDVAHGALAVDLQEHLDRASVERDLVGARRGGGRQARHVVEGRQRGGRRGRKRLDVLAQRLRLGVRNQRDRCAVGKREVGVGQEQRASIDGIDTVVLTARGGDQVALVEGQLGGVVGRGEVQDARFAQLAKQAHERGQADPVESPGQFNHGELEACCPRRGSVLKGRREGAREVDWRSVEERSKVESSA